VNDAAADAARPHDAPANDSPASDSDAHGAPTDAADDAGDDAADDGDAIAPPCEADAAPRCHGQTPQRCFSGAWIDQIACRQGTYCAEGACRRMPPSCPTLTSPYPCDTREIPGGTFVRDFDADGSAPPADAAAPATVHAVLLDTYEVTTGRFSYFEDAVNLGYSVSAGAGKHTHLNGGLGLVVGDADGGPVYESGWDPSWSTGFATSAAGWDHNLDCTPVGFTTVYEASPTYPVNCVTWFEAYAFCIWDGGFLPTEAEWSFAAAGGDEQRAFPWGLQTPPQDGSYAIWGCYNDGSGTCTDTAHDIGQVFREPAGVARWGHWQLAGNVAEWTLDAYAPYVAPCVDCAAPSGSQRVFRGGGYDSPALLLGNTHREAADPATRVTELGFRCARSP
jgi:formylglycine-generating enzyme required for sulfatase activity